MIGIESVGIYLPESEVDNYASLEKFDVDEKFIEEKIGVRRFYRKKVDEDTSDLCVKAFNDLLSKSHIDVEMLECVVVCTQNPDLHGLPHTSAIVHKKLNLPKSCAVFDISLGCSGYVYGLKIIKGFMSEMGYRSGVLFTADPYSKIIDDEDKNTSLLFGDAASATYVTQTPTWLIGPAVFGSDGIKSDAIKVDAQTALFQMNGRAVFNFAATAVPKNVKEALAANELDLSDIDLFVMHQGSKYMIETIADRLGVPRDKVPFYAANYGNTVSSSIPLALNSVLDSSVSRVLISGFGVGLSWGSLVLTKKSGK